MVFFTRLYWKSVLAAIFTTEPLIALVSEDPLLATVTFALLVIVEESTAALISTFVSPSSLLLVLSPVTEIVVSAIVVFA